MSQYQGGGFFVPTIIEFIETLILLQGFKDYVEETCKFEIIYKLENSNDRQATYLHIFLEITSQSIGKNKHKEITHSLFLFLLRKGSHLTMSHVIRRKNFAWHIGTEYVLKIFRQRLYLLGIVRALISINRLLHLIQASTRRCKIFEISHQHHLLFGRHSVQHFG